jgi:hypothetical protein
MSNIELTVSPVGQVIYPLHSRLGWPLSVGSGGTASPWHTCQRLLGQLGCCLWVPARNSCVTGSGTRLPPPDSVEQAVDIAYGHLLVGSPGNLPLGLLGCWGFTLLSTPVEALQQGCFLL